jgi:hypothetical protein
MTERLMARLVFDSDSDLDLPAEELRKAGYEVHRMPMRDLLRYHLDDDHIEAVIAGPFADKIVDAVWREVEDIAHRYGGMCLEVCTIESDYIPFEPPGRMFWTS